MMDEERENASSHYLRSLGASILIIIIVVVATCKLQLSLARSTYALGSFARANAQMDPPELELRFIDTIARGSG